MYPSALQNQKLFVDYLTTATVNATDLQPNYSGVVADAWSAFYGSDCGAEDPTCAAAQESLGR